MKYILVIGDGMADTALTELDGNTPLHALSLPSFDRVASCHTGRVLTVPEGQPAGSDTAILSIFGYDPRVCYSGRSALEAAGMSIALQKGEISFRVNLCSVIENENNERIIHSHNGGNIHGEEAVQLMQALLTDPQFKLKMEQSHLVIHPTDTFRHIGVFTSDAKEIKALTFTEPHNILMNNIADYLPKTNKAICDPSALQLLDDVYALMELSYDILKDHPINKDRIARGLLPATMIWPWGAATDCTLVNFPKKYNKQGSVVTAVPLVWGIAFLAGLKTPKVEGATGELHTNSEGKVQATLDALASGDDFAVVHIEAPDEMAHAGDLPSKLEAIQNVESRVVAPLLCEMHKREEPFRLMLISDHPTFLTTRKHDGGPVPYAIYDSQTVARSIQEGKELPTRKFSEKGLANEPLLLEGTELMSILFSQA